MYDHTSLPSSRYNRIQRALVAVAIALGLAASAFASSAKPKLVGLLFHADWCASCKALEPKLQAVKKDFAGEPVLFTRLDLTDAATKGQSALLAAQLGLSSAFAENASKTGFMLLLDATTGRTLAKLTKTHSEEELRHEIRRALGG